MTILPFGMYSVLILLLLAAAQNIIQLIAIQDCDDGTYEGENAVDDIYDDDCSNVLERSFERRVTRETNRLLHRERTWHDRVFNRCFKKAVKKRLREIGNECLDDPDVADDCDELGEVAARLIVQGKNWGYAWGVSSHLFRIV